VPGPADRFLRSLERGQNRRSHSRPVSALERLAQGVQLLDQPLAGDEHFLIEFLLMMRHCRSPVPITRTG
jgi:hypothetical protein